MKKLFLSILLLTVCKLSSAMEIDCFDAGTRIYHGIGHNVQYGDYFILFREAKSNKNVYVSGNCIVKWTLKEEKHIK
jgi:hypothetical protein